MNKNEGESVNGDFLGKVGEGQSVKWKDEVFQERKYSLQKKQYMHKRQTVLLAKGFQSFICFKMQLTTDFSSALPSGHLQFPLKF